MSSVEPRADELTVDGGALLIAVLVRLLRVIVVTALLAGIAYLVMLAVPREYQSATTLLVEPRQALPATGEAVPAPIDVDALMASQIDLIRSRDVLLEVVDTQNLRSVPELNGVGFSPLNLVLQLIGRKPAAVSVDDTVLQNLSNRLSVTRQDDSSVLSISVRSANADLAAKIANAIASEYLSRRAAQSVSDNTDTAVWLQQQITTLRQKVKDADAAVANYKVDNDLYSGAGGAPVTDQQLSNISAQIADAQSRKAAAESRAELIRGLVQSGQPLDGVADVRQSVVIQGLTTSLSNLQAELAQKSTTLLANHPTIKALKAQIAEIQAQIATEGKRVASALDAEAKVEADLVTKLNADLDRAKQAAGTAAKGGVTLDDLQRQAQAQRDQLTSYLSRYTDAAAQGGASALPGVRILSVATPSASPSTPDTWLVVGATAAIALLLQIAGIVLGEMGSGRAVVVRERRSEPEVLAEAVVVAGAAVEAEPAATPMSARAAAEAIVAMDRERVEKGADEIAFADDAELEAATAAVEAARSALPRAPVVDQLGELALALTSQRNGTILIAAVDRLEDEIAVADRLVADVMSAGLSAVEVDAGSGSLSLDQGLTDLAAGRAEYGDVITRVRDDLALVPWGRLQTLDRRSARPQTLVTALADVYHVVVVNTGRLGNSSSLALFAGSGAPVVLVVSDLAGSAVEAAREEVAAMGLNVGFTVAAPKAKANVA